LAVSYGGVKG